MITRILLAYDGSAPSDKAFEFAADLAVRYHANLRILTVAQAPEIGDEVETEAVIEHSRAYHQSLLDRLRERASHLGLSATFRLAVGHAAGMILDEAQSQAVDLIVLGHRGHGVLDRWRLGSVTHRVISYAECAVTVVR